MTRVVFHVGLSKTGTTALQDDVFPAIAGIRYLGPKGAAPGDRVTAAAARRIGRALEHETRRVVDAPYAGLLRARDHVMGLGGTVLFSEEALTTNTGVETTGYDRIPLMPGAIAGLFPDAAVVLVLREPSDHLASLLLQRMASQPLVRGIDRPRPLTPRQQLDWHVLRGRRRDPLSIFSTMMRFDRTVALFRERFGPDRFHLLAYERLFAPARPEWRAAFAAILGVPVEVPDPGRRNVGDDERRRTIAERFFAGPDETPAADAWIAAMRAAPQAIAEHGPVQRFIALHCREPWQAAMAAP
ncbi:MAG: hypothetical protein AB7O45_12195 [Alphaproteobacteria bacterium]